MRQFLTIAALMLVSFFVKAQDDSSFQKGTGGTVYRIIHNNASEKITYGSYVEFSFKYNLEDTVFGSSDEMGRQIFLMDSTRIPPVYFDIFKRANIGDSIVLKMVSDSFFHENFPPFAKKGETVYSGFKLLNAYANAKQADSVNAINMKFAQAKQMEAFLKQARRDSIDAIPQMAKDELMIRQYLAVNKTIAVRAPLGTYVKILKPGQGKLIGAGMVVTVKYTGRSFEGIPFDSNTDPAFHHTEPYKVEIPENIYMAQVIHGWIDGLKLLRKGSKARFYIPSTLGYGKNGNGEKILPDENLLFDIEVVNVMPKKASEAEPKKQSPVRKTITRNKKSTKS